MLLLDHCTKQLHSEKKQQKRQNENLKNTNFFISVKMRLNLEPQQNLQNSSRLKSEQENYCQKLNSEKQAKHLKQGTTTGKI